MNVEPKAGQLVMFANRTQICSTGMKVLEVDHDLFGVRLKIDAGPSQVWWVPECFMLYEEWKLPSRLHPYEHVI